MIPTNWWNNPPYVTTQISSNSSREGGILPVILESIVTSCCQECEFGTTTVDFKLDANGLDAQKDGVIQVKDAINSKSMISFGITGVMPQEKYYSADGEAEYVPIMETPGVAFIVAERRLDYRSWSLLNYRRWSVLLSNRPHFLWVYRHDNPRGMLGEHEKRSFSSILPTSQVGYHAGNP